MYKSKKIFFDVIQRRPRLSSLIFLIVGIIIGFFSIYIFEKINSDKNIIPVRQNSSEFHYINPLLFIDNSEENFEEYESLERDIKNYIKESKQNGDAKEISLYLRDMNTSHWGGVDQDLLYAPSSMLKVGVLTSFLKLAEKKTRCSFRKSILPLLRHSQRILQTKRSIT